jgi:hypothetical protein
LVLFDKSNAFHIGDERFEMEDLFPLSLILQFSMKGTLTKRMSKGEL